MLDFTGLGAPRTPMDVLVGFGLAAPAGGNVGFAAHRPLPGRPSFISLACNILAGALVLFLKASYSLFPF